ncbi:TM2 domain-containing protein [Rhodopirellula sp. P2]|uniref:TM2 domain-containing protein n=1 Tax=Rhodopirellula sp. P2 TaxID=2127060 RepID=UPI002367B48C|nr:NINE protein [Rhodopirellula sp. P2]WDQ19364.1 NINE protein [Rhodopirellula sp. P2]
MSTQLDHSQPSTSPAPGYLPPPETHSVVIGYIVWIFGFFGAHRFYYGKQITGTIWFFTLGLAGIGWLIDLFLIPGMDRRAQMRFTTGPVDYTIAWILLTFLGLFGIHRFYLEKWFTGVIYLLTGGLFGLGWLYDLWTLNEQVDQYNRRAASTN